MDAITFNDLTGKHEAAYAERYAWHNKGVIVTGDLSSPAFLQASGLGGWNIELQGLQTVTGIEIPGQFATVRTDTNKVLGTVGARYRVYQNEDIFKFLDSLHDELQYESAFSMFDSTRVCVVARLPKSHEIIPGDTTLDYLMALTSHDGSCATVFVPTSIRVVCNNAVQMALKGGRHLIRAVRHTENQEERLSIVKGYLQDYCKEFQEYAERCKRLAAKKFTNDMFTRFIAELFPRPEEDASTRTKNRYDETRANLITAYKHPTNNLEAMKGTLWQMLNTVTYAVDHLSNGHRTEDTNLDSVLFGKKAELKMRAMDLALAMAS